MKKLLLIILLFKVTTLMALAIDNFKEHIYNADDGDTLETISKDFYKKNVKLYRSVELYQSELKRWNPHVRNWNKIGDGTKIYITNPYPPNLDYDYAPTLPYIPKAE